MEDSIRARSRARHRIAVLDFRAGSTRLRAEGRRRGVTRMEDAAREIPQCKRRLVG